MLTATALRVCEGSHELRRHSTLGYVSGEGSSGGYAYVLPNQPSTRVEQDPSGT